ncbi:MAG: SIMPL domain-containing protein [Burkholderiaceae bacterium]|jgi:predicted secreted protein|nr:SIMPL domain-containing protein [Burkholderiaceae bacterium]
MLVRALTAISAAALAAAFVAVPAAAQPQQPQRADGTLLLMTAGAVVEVDNDEARAMFFFEAQEAELPRAQSLVNQRVAEGVAQLKRADPSARVETSGYSSYPVYQPGSQRKLVGWRVRQGVTLRTGDLAALPRTVAAAQQHLALGGIDFQLSRAARTRVEAELIEQAIGNLNDKIAAAARVLKVPAERVRLEELNFGAAPPPVPRMRADMMAAAAPPVEEPQFDAGRSAQQLTVTGKARLLPP